MPSAPELPADTVSRKSRSRLCSRSVSPSVLGVPAVVRGVDHGRSVWPPDTRANLHEWGFFLACRGGPAQRGGSPERDRQIPDTYPEMEKRPSSSCSGAQGIPVSAANGLANGRASCQLTALQAGA